MSFPPDSLNFDNDMTWASVITTSSPHESVIMDATRAKIMKAMAEDDIEGKYVASWDDTMYSGDSLPYDEAAQLVEATLAEFAADWQMLAERSTVDFSIQRYGTMESKHGVKAIWCYFITPMEVHVALVADDPVINEWCRAVKDALSVATGPKEDGDVRFWVTWHNGMSGVSVSNINVPCPEWEAIQGNYAAKTRSSVYQLIQKAVAEEYAGRLIIWHGSPGTGKTYMIRTMARMLRDTHRFVFVSDVNSFLDIPTYYYEVVSRTNKPVVFVLEDAADGLLKDARIHQGSRIARLLNLSDGIITQGRKDLFLVTFNEDINELDPAIVRPGRCLNITAFDRFPVEEAQQWLRDQGYEDKVNELTEPTYSLAELYAMINGETTYDAELETAARRVIGFTAG